MKLGLVLRQLYVLNFTLAVVQLVTVVSQFAKVLYALAVNFRPVFQIWKTELQLKYDVPHTFATFV